MWVIPFLDHWGQQLRLELFREGERGYASKFLVDCRTERRLQQFQQMTQIPLEEMGVFNDSLR